MLVLFRFNDREVGFGGFRSPGWRGSPVLNASARIGAAGDPIRQKNALKLQEPQTRRDRQK